LLQDCPISYNLCNLLFTYLAFISRIPVPSVLIYLKAFPSKFAITHDIFFRGFHGGGETLPLKSTTPHFVLHKL